MLHIHLILSLKAKSKERTSKIDKEAALNTYLEMAVTFSIIRNRLHEFPLETELGVEKNGARYGCFSSKVFLHEYTFKSWHTLIFTMNQEQYARQGFGEES